MHKTGSGRSNQWAQCRLTMPSSSMSLAERVQSLAAAGSTAGFTESNQEKKSIKSARTGYEQHHTSTFCRAWVKRLERESEAWSPHSSTSQKDRTLGWPPSRTQQVCTFTLLSLCYLSFHSSNMEQTASLLLTVDILGFKRAICQRLHKWQSCSLL